MESIKLRARRNDSVYKSEFPNMAIVSQPNTKGTHGSKGWTTCREYLTGSLATSIRALYNNQILLKQLEENDADKDLIKRVKNRVRSAYQTDKIRVGLEWNNRIKPSTNAKRVENAVKIINVIEKEMGIKPKDRSKAFKVEGRDRIFVVKGPKIWIAGSHGFSLYMLFLRCLGRTGRWEKFKSLKDLLATVANSGGGHGTDIGHLKSFSASKLTTFIMNMDKIYTGRSHLDSFTKEVALLSGSLQHDGITSLMRGWSRDELTKTNLNKYMTIEK